MDDKKPVLQSIYAFEFEKIECCGQCPCYNDDGGGCRLGYMIGWRRPEYNDPKPDDCPLVQM